jgi:hypothetical protein
VRRRVPIALIVALGAVVLTACSATRAHPSTSRLSSSCQTLFGPRPPLPRPLSSSLSASLLSRFALFRRGPTRTDEPPLEDGLQSALFKSYELSGFYPAYARKLAVHAGGRAYFVVPAFARREAVPAAHCASATERRIVSQEQRRRLVEPVYCILDVGGAADSPVPGCEPFAQIGESARAFHVSDLLGEPTVELVPDGVAGVRIAYRARPAFVRDVRENAFVLTPPRSPRTRLDTELMRLLHESLDEHLTRRRREQLTEQAYAGTYPTKIEWLDSSGHAMRTLAPPPAEGSSKTSVGDLRAPVEGQ